MALSGFPQKSWKWRSPGKVPELGLVTEYTQMAGRVVVTAADRT